PFQIRRNFIRFFENYDHVHVPSSSLVPPFEDRSLLFTNAGMNQFKSVFLGRTDNRWAFLERAVSYQKCLRVGGKHNDLEVVGRDLHHQTFFEMLGNWSFNDSYSKENACMLAWHFLTDILRIDPARLYVSYFGGSKELNLPPDESCRKIWLKIGVAESHILPFTTENIWEMGATGPCGLCTEIHYDRIPGRRNAGHLVNVDDSIVELWNIVFISMMRTSNGNLEPLPSHHIDTGMGLERLASVMQDVPSNFDTDALAGIIKSISSISKAGPYSGKVGSDDCGEHDASYRILADHMRGVVVSLADGVEPGACDAGFVIRKMLRRSFWHAVSRLGIDRHACAALVPVVVSSLKQAYPELRHHEESAAKCVAEEERQFWNIVDKEVTRDLAKKHALTLDVQRFEELKQEAKELSKRTSTFTSSDPVDVSDLHRHTDTAKYVYIRNGAGSYEFPPMKTNILAVFDNGKRVPSISCSGSIVLENCQFHAEEGGQKCDRGILESEEGPIFEVLDVQKVNGVAVLHGNVVGNQSLSGGLAIKQKIDVNRRMALMRAHSATHLLNWALRVVGAGGGQRGSSISEDSLRFDYATEDCAGEDDIMEAVESLVRKVIVERKNVVVEEMPLSDALQLSQLQSEFREGKEYPQVVRVVRVGDTLGDAIALECCSGT
ncbi:unnamed protein product, partial [Nippostrongylus brasiliensis]|uniref:alanine--tRNA ligase n=1 Tax=Nippostrongylus brasiliensis TaxID=27835 RepID=A0A158R370_NIPBR